MRDGLPKGWVKGILNEIINSIKTGVQEYPDKKEYYSTGSIRNRLFISEGAYCYKKRLSRANRQAKLNDIFQARMKETDKGLLVDEKLSDQLFFTGFIQLRVYGKTYNPKLLFYFIKTHYFINQRDKLATGSTQKALTDTKAKELIFLLPPYNEQKRIVKKLDSIMPRIDTVKERLESIPRIIKRFRQSVLIAAVTGKLTEKWREEHLEVESAEVLLERIRYFRIENATNKRELNFIEKLYKEGEIRLKSKQSPYDLPRTWKYCEINSIGNVYNGSTPSRKMDEYWGNDINWISSGEVQNCFINSTKEKISRLGFANSSLRLFPRGTVMIAMIGEGKTRGQTSILDIEATCNQNVAAVVLDHNCVLPRYLFYWFLLRYEINRSFGSGSGPKALNCQKVRELDFILPPLKEQREIVRHVERLFAFADKVEEHYRKAKDKIDRLSQSVLAKAFRGELVPQDPKDEPAEKLLERIKEEKMRLEMELKKNRSKTAIREK